MKKLVIISFLLSTIQLLAQDTIRFGDSHYLWAGDSLVYSETCVHDEKWYSEDVHMRFISQGFMEYYTDHPIYIYGIAVIANSDLQNPTTNGCASIAGKLYQRDVDGIFLRDSFSVTPENYAEAFIHRNIFDYQYSGGLTGWMDPDTILQFYYDKPILVHDTFYAGFYLAYMPEFNMPNNYEFCNFFTNHIRFAECCITPTYNRIAVPNWGLSTFTYGPPDTWHIFPAQDVVSSIWPIIEIEVEDTIPPCPVPNTPELIEAEDGFVSIRWAANSTVAGYEIAFGTDTLNPENNSIIETTSNVKFFSGLENNRYYAAWLRYKCHHHCYWHDTNTYSDWSEPLVFYLSDGNTEPEFIGSVLDLQMSIYPNPAKDEIMIETDGVPMQQLELYDIQGRLLKRVSQMEDREKYRLSIESLPTGRYVVKAITPFGITTQSFVKQ